MPTTPAHSTPRAWRVTAYARLFPLPPGEASLHPGPVTALPDMTPMHGTRLFAVTRYSLPVACTADFPPQPGSFYKVTGLAHPPATPTYCSSVGSYSLNRRGRRRRTIRRVRYAALVRVHGAAFPPPARVLPLPVPRLATPLLVPTGRGRGAPHIHCRNSLQVLHRATAPSRMFCCQPAPTADHVAFAYRAVCDITYLLPMDGLAGCHVTMDAGTFCLFSVHRYLRPDYIRVRLPDYLFFAFFIS